MNKISTSEWIKLYGGSIREISKPHEIEPWKYPNTIDPIQNLLSKTFRGRSYSNNLFVACFENVYVVNGKILDVSLKNEVSEYSKCGDFYDEDFDPSKISKEIDCAVHLIDKWGGSNYWHWISTCLSKLFMIDNKEKNNNILINSLNNRYVKESLGAFQINVSKCLEIDVRNSVFCKKLIAPSPMGDRDKEGILFLRNKLRNNKIKPKNKIYISRRKLRRVLNESEIISFLNKRGFQDVQCENMTFEQQINLFSGAQVVVAPHGAGLTNIMFAPDNTKVLELRSPKHFGICYWRLCNHLNLPYYSLLGEGAFPQNSKDLTREINSDMEIDVKKLEEMLNMMAGLKTF